MLNENIETYVDTYLVGRDLTGKFYHKEPFEVGLSDNAIVIDISFHKHRPTMHSSFRYNKKSNELILWLGGKEYACQLPRNEIICATNEAKNDGAEVSWHYDADGKDEIDKWGTRAIFCFKQDELEKVPAILSKYEKYLPHNNMS